MEPSWSDRTGRIACPCSSSPVSCQTSSCQTKKQSTKPWQKARVARPETAAAPTCGPSDRTPNQTDAKTDSHRPCACVTHAGGTRLVASFLLVWHDAMTPGRIPCQAHGTSQRVAHPCECESHLPPVAGSSAERSRGRVVCSHGDALSASAYPRCGHSEALEQPEFLHCLDGVLRTRRNVSATHVVGQVWTARGLVKPHEPYIRPAPNLIRGHSPGIHGRADDQHEQDDTPKIGFLQGLPQGGHRALA